MRAGRISQNLWSPVNVQKRQPSSCHSYRYKWTYDDGVQKPAGPRLAPSFLTQTKRVPYAMPPVTAGRWHWLSRAQGQLFFVTIRPKFSWIISMKNVAIHTAFPQKCGNAMIVVVEETDRTLTVTYLELWVRCLAVPHCSDLPQPHLCWRGRG